jgi:hypothetical protein
MRDAFLRIVARQAPKHLVDDAIHAIIAGTGPRHADAQRIGERSVVDAKCWSSNVPK